MNQDTQSQKCFHFGKLYLFGLFPYWTIVGIIFLSLSLINGRGHRLAHLLEWPVGIHFLLLGIVLLLLHNLCLAGCAAIIIKWAKGFNLQAKIALLILGTYWYNIVLIPCSILQLLAKGSSPNAQAIILVGPILFLLPSLALILACHRSAHSHQLIDTP